MNRHLLIIDDDLIGAELLARALRLRNFTAECVETFDQGKAYLASHDVAVTICDLCLRETDGLLTVARFREIDATKVIAYTASPDRELVNAVVESGAGYARKLADVDGAPAGIAPLVEKILMRIERHAPSREIANEIIENSRPIPAISNETKVSLSITQMIVLVSAIVASTFAVAVKIGDVESSVEKLKTQTEFSLKTVESRIASMENTVKVNGDSDKVRDAESAKLNLWRWNVTTDLRRIGEQSKVPVTTRDP